MMRWPHSDPPGVQPYNDAVRTELETILEGVVVLADEIGLSGLEAIETFENHAFGDADVPWQAWFDRLDEILQPHVTPEFDISDLTYELRELIGDDASDDNFND